MPNLERLKAIKQGLKTYNGKPCKQCQCTIKRVDNYTCIKCGHQRNILDRLNNPDKWKKSKQISDRKYRLKEAYNLTSEEFALMANEQYNKCLICHKPPDGKYKRLCIDHCHLTNKIRGLLCSKCNTAIGLMYENVANIENMIFYLKKYKNELK